MNEPLHICEYGNCCHIRKYVKKDTVLLYRRLFGFEMVDILGRTTKFGRKQLFSCVTDVHSGVRT